MLLISTITYLEGDFIKRTTDYHSTIRHNNDDAYVLEDAVHEQYKRVQDFIRIAGMTGETTIGEIIRLPMMPDKSISYMFNVIINKQRYSFYVQVADTQSDTI